MATSDPRHATSTSASTPREAVYAARMAAGRPAAPRWPYHLVITLCARPPDSRHLATTLLSVFLHDAEPDTLAVLWRVVCGV